MIKARAPELLRRALRLGFAAGAALVLVSTAQAQGDAPRVYVMPTSGIVDQVMQGYIREGIAKADREGAAAVLIQLDTPGGDLTATDAIVENLLEAPLPVIVWVGPGGSRAASAGTFITLSAHVAVMDPDARIGAATPIDSSGGDIPGALGAKILQDTEAQLRIISNSRHRNYDWALTTVTESKAYTASEALAAGGIDGIATTLEDAIALANGRTVTVGAQAVTLNLAGATTTDLPMNPFQSLLHLLADPNIAFILFTLGFYGLLFELQNPNFVTGTLGALAIVLAFIGFGSLPLNLGGLLLMGIGIVLFIVDVHVTNHGLPTIAGIICFALGASALYTEPGTPTAPVVQVAFPIIAAMVLTSAIFMGAIVTSVVRQRRLPSLPSLVGPHMASGLVGQIRRPTEPLGTVFAADEEWSARSVDGGVLSRGTPVRVVRQEGLTVVVEPFEPGGSKV